MNTNRMHHRNIALTIAILAFGTVATLMATDPTPNTAANATVPPAKQQAQASEPDKASAEADTVKIENQNLRKAITVLQGQRNQLSVQLLDTQTQLELYRQMMVEQDQQISELKKAAKPVDPKPPEKK